MSCFGSWGLPPFLGALCHTLRHLVCQIWIPGCFCSTRIFTSNHDLFPKKISERVSPPTWHPEKDFQFLGRFCVSNVINIHPKNTRPSPDIIVTFVGPKVSTNQPFTKAVKDTLGITGGRIREMC